VRDGDEMIEFWRWIREQAADHRIRIHVFTCNVFVCPKFFPVKFFNAYD
jgi:hypothetical protein